MKEIDLEDTVDSFYDTEQSDEEWLDEIRRSWDDYDTDLAHRSKRHHIDQTPSKNSVLGRRIEQRAKAELKRLNKDKCEICGSIRELATYRKRGHSTWVRLCLQCAIKNKDSLAFNKYRKLAKF